jgi:hypothetical protein
MNQFLQNWKHRWQRAWRKHAARTQLELMSSAERMRLADDVGISGVDLRRFHCSHNGPSELMPRRLGQLGVDVGYVKYELPATYRDLERVCAGCKAARRCERDLARGDAQAGMRSYCLNAATIDSLCLDRAERRA